MLVLMVRFRLSAAIEIVPKCPQFPANTKGTGPLMVMSVVSPLCKDSVSVPQNTLMLTVPLTTLLLKT